MNPPIEIPAAHDPYEDMHRQLREQNQQIRELERLLQKEKEKSSRVPEFVVAHKLEGFSETPCTHPPLAPAIQRCCEARNQTLRQENAKIPILPTPENPNFDGNYDALVYRFTLASSHACALADEAFRANLPELTSAENAQDFLACVAHGIAIGSIQKQFGQRLLAAARIALLNFHRTASHGTGRKPQKRNDNGQFCG